MPAYVIANVEVHDPETYATYVEAVPASIARHNGRYLARGGRTEVLEGNWEPKRLVIVEFPTFEDAKAWYESADYADVKAIRLATTTSELVLTEGR